MEILINEIETIEGVKGFNVALINRNKKRSINDADFFDDASDIGQKVIQLKRLLKIYFDSQV